MLTGRMQAFTDPAHYDDVTGYTNPKESDYDLFSLGHTSSAVSLASGLAKARDLKGGKENVIAVSAMAHLAEAWLSRALTMARLSAPTSLLLSMTMI